MEKNEQKYAVILAALLYDIGKFELKSMHNSSEDFLFYSRKFFNEFINLVVAIT